MKTETLALILAATIAHAFLFYACGTERRLCLSTPSTCTIGHAESEEGGR